MTCIGAVTIGQSPRPDITAELAAFFEPAVRIIESGALDGFEKSEVEDILPRASGPLLVTRLRDGSEVKIGEDFLIPHLQACVQRLQSEADLILVLCTESLPQFESDKLVLYPGRLLFQMVRALGARRVGILTPAEEQLEHQAMRWSGVVSEPFVESASPYGRLGRLQSAAQSLAARNVDLIVMDCLGYTQSMKRIVRACANRPVVLARSVLARAAAELLE